MPDLFDRAKALAFYRRGFALAATCTPLQAKTWLAQEAVLSLGYGEGIDALMAEAQREYEAETGRGAYSGEGLVDDDF